MSVALTAGTRFGRYRIDAPIGRGGMGVVYRASDLSLKRPVALKLIAPELAQDPRFRRRFLMEPQLAASLDHPNVIPIYEAGEDAGQLFLAMRLVDGDDLATILRREISLGLDRTLALLAPIASALDAAHDHALVHRDVKPGNVLVDSKGHVYLTDFGVTKHIGGDSTDTVGIVGSLDYLAPEQIDGAGVDARTDVYALGCVLYECLAGRPPFRRESEAETLWAHMRVEYAPLSEHPALDPVLKRAFARDPGGRYATCGELIDAARNAHSRLPSGLVRHRRTILGVGAAVLAVTAAVAVPTLKPTDHDSPVGTGLAALDADGHRHFTTEDAPPSNVAAGEGAIWMLDGENETVARADPASGKVVRRFPAGRRPTNIAAGAGALWIGSAGSKQREAGFMRRISRLDPDSGAVTGTVLLTHASSPFGPVIAEGLPQIAIGASAVWAIGPDDSVYRIDPQTLRVVARIPTDPRPSTIAAGPEGVWFLNFLNTDVTRIDPATNRISDKVRVNSDFLAGIAVGAGAVWVTSPQDGLLRRIEPGPQPREISISATPGVWYVAFGSNAVWTGSYSAGAVTRVDARTNATTAFSIGAPQALTASGDAAWISVAGGTRDGTLPPGTCTEVAAGGRSPDVLIASDLALRVREAGPRAMVDAIRFVLKDHGYRAGRYTVGYQSCDNSSAEVADHEQRKCAANATAFAPRKGRRRGHRTVGFMVRDGRDSDPQPRAERTVGAGHRKRNASEPDTPGSAPGRRHCGPRCARGVLPHGHAQLLPHHPARRPARRRRGDPRPAARPAVGVPPARPRRPAPSGRDRPVQACGETDRDANRRRACVQGRRPRL